MECEPSFEAEPGDSEEDYIPAASTARWAGRRGSRRGASARGRQGGGRRSSQTPDDLGTADIARIENLRSQRIAYECEQIQRLDLNQAHHILQRSLSRDPRLIFDVLSQVAPTTPPLVPPVQFQPSWCICQRCREMPTLVEKKCCNQQPEMCISRLPHMDLYILQEGVLRLARRMWNELRAVADLTDPGEDNRQFRHAAYRQFVAWQYGVLGSGHRVVIQSCCVWRIRDCFPDPHGQYRGFIPRRV